MSRQLTNSRWFDVATKAQFDCLKAYGDLTPPKPRFGFARVQKGAYSGPGRYLLLTYTQRCPRNCCDDDVSEVLSAMEVAQEVCEEMRELASILREARRSAPQSSSP